MESYPALDPRKQSLLEARITGNRVINNECNSENSVNDSDSQNCPMDTDLNLSPDKVSSGSQSTRPEADNALNPALKADREKRRKRKTDNPLASADYLLVNGQGQSQKHAKQEPGSAVGNRKISDYFWGGQPSPTPKATSPAPPPPPPPAPPAPPPAAVPPSPEQAPAAPVPAPAPLLPPQSDPRPSTSAPPAPPTPSSDSDSAATTALRRTPLPQESARKAPDSRVEELLLENEDLKRQLAAQKRLLDSRQQTVDKCVEVIKSLLIEKSELERRECRETSMKNRLRLGQYISDQNFKEHWVEGYAFKDIRKKLARIAQEREDIERQRKVLAKRKPGAPQPAPAIAGAPAAPSTPTPAAGTNGPLPAAAPLANGTSPAADFAKPTDPKPLRWQDYYEQDEILKLRQAALKKEEQEYNAENERLEREAHLCVRELKRIFHEDRSRFNSHPILNDRYLLLTLLGKGGFGEVHKAFDLREQRYVACKIHQVNSAWKEERQNNYVKHALREYNIHKDLNHPRIVRLYDVFEIDNTSFATIMEYCEGYDLDFYLKQNKQIAEKEARNIIVQVMSALRYLNELSRPVIHYDLNPKNILLGPNGVCGEIKITDFGLSKQMEMQSDEIDLTSQGAGTYWYLPPECFLETHTPRVSSKVDVWALGVVFYQCLYGKKPYANNMSHSNIVSQRAILECGEVEFAPKPPVSEAARRFIQRCLTRNKDLRPAVLELSQDDYLKSPSLKRKEASLGNESTSSSPQSSSTL